MRHSRIWLLMIIASVYWSGCASLKKYNESVENGRWLKQLNSELLVELDSVTNELVATRNSAQYSMLEKEDELKSKERAIRQREKALEDLENLVKEQRNALRSLHQEVCNALKCFTPEELSVEVRNGKLYVSLSDKLLFPSGSDRVDERGREAIVLLSQVMAQSDLDIMIEGHTDSIPIHNIRNTDNWDLSVHRATSVTRIMVENGISTKRVIPCGRGKFQPIADNENSDGRQLNRRTEIVLAPRLDRLWKLTEDENMTSSIQP